jgi:hypothetical protein
LSDGDPAADEDCWFRFVTDARWITADNIISEQALKCYTPDVPRPWAHEWSGRLNSLTTDVGADGNAYVEAIRSRQAKPNKNLQFVGTAFNSPRNLRGTIGQKHIRTGIFHTPIDPPDRFASPAHADFVTVDSHDDDLDEIRTWLQERLKVLRVSRISEMPSLCAATPNIIQAVPAVSTSAVVTKIVVEPRP